MAENGASVTRARAVEARRPRWARARARERAAAARGHRARAFLPGPFTFGFRNPSSRRPLRPLSAVSASTLASFFLAWERYKPQLKLPSVPSFGADDIFRQVEMLLREANVLDALDTGAYFGAGSREGISSALDARRR